MHRGFTGLLYAVAYQAHDALEELLDLEYECKLAHDTALRVEQQLHFVPRDSTVVHLCMLTNSDAVMQRVLTRVKPSSPVWAESNRMQLTPIVLMAGLGLCLDPVVEQFL